MTQPEFNTTRHLNELLHCVQGGQTEIADQSLQIVTGRALGRFYEEKKCLSLRSETNNCCNLILGEKELEYPTREEWEAFKERIDNATGKLFQKSEAALGPRMGLYWIQKKIFEFDRNLKVNDINRKSVLAWHVMCRSTTTYEDSPVLDLSGPFSVKESINALLLELEDKEKCMQYVNQNRLLRRKDE